METKELMPEYVLQPHMISRGMYRLSGTARKLIAMGMAIIPSDMSSLTATFSLNEFCHALGLERSGERYRIVQDGILECIQVPIIIETPEKWKTFTWVQTAEIDKRTNMITIIFSVGLMEYLQALKKMYARIDLMDMGKLQSLYAIRLFELAKSYESLAGKQGNLQNTWYFERTPEEMRHIFGIEDDEYPKMHDFKRYAIERPISEVNLSNLGVSVILETIKRGRTIQTFRFVCKKEPRTVTVRTRKGVPLEAPAPVESPETLEEKELEHLMKLYPQEYADLYADLLSHPTNNFFKDSPQYWERQAQHEAQKILRDRHGVRK
jgi:plasmid replication initiation protein